jgi:outer membrane protein
MRKKYRMAFICLVILGVMIATEALAADKVGYINLQRLVNESDMGKEAKKEIQELRREREATVGRKLREVNELKNTLNTRGSTMPLDEKRDKIEALQKAYKEYQRLVADAREDLTREDRQLVAIILSKADGVLKQVAEEEEYTIILKDPNAIGYLDPQVDITDDVLEALNQKQ